MRAEAFFFADGHRDPRHPSAGLGYELQSGKLTCGLQTIRWVYPVRRDCSIRDSRDLISRRLRTTGEVRRACRPRLALSGRVRRKARPSSRRSPGPALPRQRQGSRARRNSFPGSRGLSSEGECLAWLGFGRRRRRTLRASTSGVTSSCGAGGSLLSRSCAAAAAGRAAFATGKAALLVAPRPRRLLAPAPGRSLPAEIDSSAIVQPMKIVIGVGRSSQMSKSEVSVAAEMRAVVPKRHRHVDVQDGAVARLGPKRDVLIEAVDNPGREVLALGLDDCAQH